MRTSERSRNRMGLLKIPRILPNKFLLKLSRPFGNKLPAVLFAKPFIKK